MWSGSVPEIHRQHLRSVARTGNSRKDKRALRFPTARDLRRHPVATTPRLPGSCYPLSSPSLLDSRPRPDNSNSAPFRARLSRTLNCVPVTSSAGFFVCSSYVTKFVRSENENPRVSGDVNVSDDSESSIRYSSESCTTRITEDVPNEVMTFARDMYMVRTQQNRPGSARGWIKISENKNRQEKPRRDISAREIARIGLVLNS